MLCLDYLCGERIRPFRLVPSLLFRPRGHTRDVTGPPVLFPLVFFVHEQSFLGAHSLDYCAVPGFSLVCVGSMCVARGFYLISFDSSLRLPPATRVTSPALRCTFHSDLLCGVWIYSGQCRITCVARGFYLSGIVNSLFFPTFVTD